MNLKALFKRGKPGLSPDSSSRIPDSQQSPQAPEDFDDAVIVTDVLDLHGFFPEQVPEIIHEFIRNAENLGLRTLRIVHGKGKSKLKWAVLRELDKYPQIASYGDAAPEFGGWGSTMVYLQKQDGKKPES